MSGSDSPRISTREACELLGLTPKQLWRLVAKGMLSAPTCLTPRKCFWLRAEIERHVANPAYRDPVPIGTVVSRREAAEILGVCMETISRMAKDGRLGEPYRIGNRNMWPLIAVARAQAERNFRKLVKLGYAREYGKFEPTDFQWLLRIRTLPPVRATIGQMGSNLYWKGELEAWCRDIRSEETLSACLIY